LLFGNYGKNIRISTLMIGNENFDSHDRYIEFVSLRYQVICDCINLKNFAF
jgi:hypothetical protein